MFSTQTLALPAYQTFTAGQRTYSRIFSGLRTAYFVFVITATVTLAAGPGTLLLNGGSLLGLLQFLGLEENGSEDPCYLDAVTLGKITAATGMQFSPNVRLTSLANGVYNLRETVVIPFANPRSPAPWETSFVERNKLQPSQLFVVTDSTTDAANRLVATPGTAAVTNFAIRSYQIADNRAQVPDCIPYYRPKFRQLTQSITGSVSNQPIYIAGGLPIRMMTLGAKTNIGTVQDVITNYRVLTDSTNIHGPNQINFNDMVGFQGYEYAGSLGGNTADGASVTPTSAGVLVIDFQESGRLSNCLSPKTQGENLRAEVTGQASVTAGATSTQVLVSVTEMERIAGVTRDNIPFPV
jgi:hypothetical protein